MKSLRVILVGVLCSLLAAGNAFAVTATTTVTATVTSTSSLSVTTPIAFGSIGGTATTYRFKSTATADVSYFAAGPYEIRVYTQNGVGASYSDARGFIRDAATVAADRLYLKIWCANFNANKALPNGVDAGGAVPILATTSAYTDYLWKGLDLNGNTILDEELSAGTFSEATLSEDLNGDGDIGDSITATASSKVGESASLSWIREKDTMDEGTATAAQVGTRCVLSWNTIGQAGRRNGIQDGSLGNPFKVFLAADLSGVKNGTYTSANNTVAITTGQTAVAGVIFELFLY